MLPKHVRYQLRYAPIGVQKQVAIIAARSVLRYGDGGKVRFEPVVEGSAERIFAVDYRLGVGSQIETAQIYRARRRAEKREKIRLSLSAHI